MVSDLPPAFISRQVNSGQYFFGNWNSPAGTLVAVACAGKEECADDYRISRESFRYSALEFIENGHWKLTVGKQSWILGPGTVFFYGPNAGYRLEAIEGGPLQKYFVDFTGPEAGALLEQSFKPNFIRNFVAFSLITL